MTGWSAYEEMIRRHGIEVERPRGTPHPDHPDWIYPLDYGYVRNTEASDGDELDVFIGTGSSGLVGVLLVQHDGYEEAKLLWKTSPDEIKAAIDFLEGSVESVRLISRFTETFTVPLGEGATRVAMNPFATLDGALRYQRGRPFHHPQTLEKIFQLMGVTRVDRALDVACGTGLSTIALKDRTDLVTGVDATEAMVSIAADAANVSYAVAQAERLPFKRRSFDLLTVASGVHWFNQSLFFQDAARVLDSEGWLVLYDHPFVGCIDEPAMDEWLQQEFEHRYPTPQHGRRPDEPMGHPPDFVELDELVFDDPISLSHDEFVAYLLSNSNTITAATKGRESPEETEAWLRAQTSRWLGPREPSTFVFRGIVRCFRRSA